MKALAIAAVLLVTTAMAPAAQPSRPVMIGLEGPDADACRAVAIVSGLHRRGDNYLSVRAGPNVRARELDRLGPGRRVFVCEIAAAGWWTGIVYGRTGHEDCDISGSISRPQPYQAGWSCRSGWVSSRYITTPSG